jgi:hypothetical protein
MQQRSQIQRTHELWFRLTSMGCVQRSVTVEIESSMTPTTLAVLGTGGPGASLTMQACKPLASDLHGRQGWKAQINRYSPPISSLVSQFIWQCRILRLRMHAVGARLQISPVLQIRPCTFRNGISVFAVACFIRIPEMQGEGQNFRKNASNTPDWGVLNPTTYLPPRPLFILRCMLLLASRNRHRMQVYIRSLQRTRDTVGVRYKGT